jgi:cytochrome c553
MRRLLRLAGVSSIVLLALLVVAYGVIYLQSNRVIDRRYPVPRVALVVPSDAASIAEGERLATVRGCYLACHGPKAVGDVLIDSPLLGTINAPNLYQAAHTYSDAELAALIRYGVRPDGHGVLGMPSQTFHGLSDQDLGRIIAFLRSLPPSSGETRRVTLGPVLRIGFVTGRFKSAPAQIAELAPLPPATSTASESGRYLAQTICTECHGNALQGDSNPDFTSPDLRVVAAYGEADFKKLLREGIAIGDRQVGLMSEIAALDLSHLTDAEIDSLYLYLHDLTPANNAGGVPMP